MNIGLQTWGTEGDVRPFIALASGLQKAGHRVTVLTTEIRNRTFSDEAERLKIDIRPVGHIECSQARFKQLASDPDPGKITRLMIDAALLAGVRAIIQFNWDDIETVSEHPSIYRVNRISHRLVFPRCRTIVHHGGAGTTQAAIEAGCPSVVVAHASDQPFWGEVLKRRGAAPKMLLRRSVTTQKLAKAIKTVQKSPQMAETARRIGRQMRTENGVQLAVRLIESASP